MEAIRSLECGSGESIPERIIFLAPSSRDLGDEMSPYADAARATDNSPLPKHWKVYRYLESTAIVSREAYLERKGKNSSKVNQAVQVDLDGSTCRASNHSININDPAQRAPAINSQVARNSNEEMTPDLVRISPCVEQATSETVQLNNTSSAHTQANLTSTTSDQTSKTKASYQAVEKPSEQSVIIPDTTFNLKRKKAAVIAKLNLGPARQMGISRAGAQKRPTFLKTLEEKRALEAAQRQASTTATSTIEDGTLNDYESENALTTYSKQAETSAGFESITPPPAYRFTLATLTSIAKLLDKSDDFLSVYHGGNQEASKALFGVLAIVRRVGQLETFDNWKAQRGKEPERCEVTIQDAQGNTLMVILQGDCANRWAGEKQQQQQQKQNNSESVTSYQDQNSVSEDPTSAIDSFSSVDIEKGLDDTTILIKQDELRFMPIQEGDVVHINNLRLVGSKNPKNNQLQPCQPAVGGARKIYAIASDANQASLELCWRSNGYPKKTFDPHLVHIDRRCNTIYQLHQAWSDFQ